jgi:hypothetical protein
MTYRITCKNIKTGDGWVMGEVRGLEDVAEAIKNITFDDGDDVREWSFEILPISAEQRAREWLVAEDSWDTTTVANAIMAIHEGYRCEQEEVPFDVLVWARKHEDGNR